MLDTKTIVLVVLVVLLGTLAYQQWFAQKTEGFFAPRPARSRSSPSSNTMKINC